MREIFGAVLIVLGLFVFLSAVVGMFRFRYVLNRMHAAALADTLGIALVLLGCILLRGLAAVSWKFVLLLVFLWMTSPVSSHLIAKAEVMTQPEPEKHWEDERI